MKTFLTLLMLLAFSQIASAIDSPAGTLAIGQWASLDANSQVSGRVVSARSGGSAAAIAGATVVLVGENHELSRTKTDQAGRFQVSSLKPGIYALTVFKPGVFACGAFHVVAANRSNGNAFKSEPEIVVAKIDSSIVKSLMIRYLPPTSVNRSVGQIGNNDLSAVAAVASLHHQEQIVQHAGGMRGNIGIAGARQGHIEAAKSMNVLIFRDNVEVARAITDANGQFEIEKLPLGEYALIAAGPDGFGCVGFALVDESEMRRSSGVQATSDSRLVSQITGGAAEFGLQVAPLPLVMESFDAAVEPESDELLSEEVFDLGIVSDGMLADGVGVPVSGGGFVPGGVGAGGVGAGGFGSGGGGLGGIAGLGAIGAAIAIGASNNGGGNGGLIVVTPPVSPSSL